MKVSVENSSKDLSSFLASVRGILVYGPNRGLSKECQRKITDHMEMTCREKSGDFSRVTVAGNEIKNDEGRLIYEALQHSILGRPRLVVVTDAIDAIQRAVKCFLDKKLDVFLLVQAADLTPASPLRRLFERRQDIAAMPCFHDTKDEIAKIVFNTMTDAGITLEEQALEFATMHLSCDRIIIRNEMEKCIVYAGSSGVLTLADMQKCLCETSFFSVDDVIYAVATGDIPALDTAMTKSFAEGIKAITVLRLLQNHFVRLHQAKIAFLAGETLANVTKNIFFKRRASFSLQVQKWSKVTLVRVFSIIQSTEKFCKYTEISQDAVLGWALYHIARLYQQ